MGTSYLYDIFFGFIPQVVKIWMRFKKRNWLKKKSKNFYRSHNFEMKNAFVYYAEIDDQKSTKNTLKMS